MYQKVVIVKSRTTGKIGQYLLTLVPDIEYERQHQGEVADLFINAGDKGGFSGVAIYSVPGLDLIVRANRYTNGIKTKGIYLSVDKKEMKEKIFRLKSILRPFQLYKSSVVQSRNVSENLILQIIKDYNNLTKVDDYWIYIDENGEEYRLLDEDGDGIPDTFVDYVNERFGETKAYCNRGVARAFEILFGDSKFHNMNANTMVKYWEDHPESWILFQCHKHNIGQIKVILLWLDGLILVVKAVML